MPAERERPQVRQVGGLDPAAGSTINVPPVTDDAVPAVVIVVPPTTVVVPLPTLTGVPIVPGPTVWAQT